MCSFCIGGTGQRKLSLLPPEAEGYSARQLKIASNNGKNTLFIMPLQEELDTTPLPQDDSFFSKMPKSDCKKCGSSMPVHVLLVHLEKCQGTLQVHYFTNKPIMMINICTFVFSALIGLLFTTQ